MKCNSTYEVLNLGRHLQQGASTQREGKALLPHNFSVFNRGYTGLQSHFLIEGLILVILAGTSDPLLYSAGLHHPSKAHHTPSRATQANHSLVQPCPCGPYRAHSSSYLCMFPALNTSSNSCSHLRMRAQAGSAYVRACAHACCELARVYAVAACAAAGGRRRTA